MPLHQRAKKPLCFVIMPFTFAKSVRGKYPDMGKDEFDTIFGLLKKILGRLGYEVRRSDSRGDILAGIVYDLDRAELVVADLTGLNPNVMYELGIRHGFTKKTILITQDIQELPFDLRSHHTIEYAWITERARTELAVGLRETLKAFKDNPDISFGPVHSHLGTKRLAWREDEKRSILAKLRGLEGELQLLWNAIGEAGLTIAKNHPGVKYNPTTETYAGQLSREELNVQEPVWAALKYRWGPVYPAIDFFLATSYVPSEFDHFGDVFSFSSVLGQFRLNVHGAETTISEFLDYFEMLDMLTDDVIVLAEAVANDRYGENLQLRTTKFLAEDPESE